MLVGLTTIQGQRCRKSVFQKAVINMDIFAKDLSTSLARLDCKVSVAKS